MPPILHHRLRRFDVGRDLRASPEMHSFGGPG